MALFLFFLLLFVFQNICLVSHYGVLDKAK